MNYAAVGGVFAVLMMLISILLIASAGIGFVYGEPEANIFSYLALGCLVIGLVMHFVLRRFDRTVRVREGFFITGLTYFVIGLVCAVPFLVTEREIVDSFTDAAFESFSGATTTGATVLTSLEEMPRAILFFRAALQWLGGMGIIVLAVAILPTLRVGGMQLFRSEAPGTIDDTSLQPRITQAAKTLWLLYLGLTVICGVAYWFAGMSPFDALCHAFTTVALGGFANYDASLAYFDSAAIKWIAIAFMLLAGLNFSLHYKLIFELRNPLIYFRDPEARIYFTVIAAVAVVVILSLLSVVDGPDQFILDAIFQAVSFATTAGFTTASVDNWPLLCAVVLVLASFIGACVGSTGGGIKCYRVLVVAQQGIREIRRLILPDGVFTVKLGQSVVSDRVIEAVWGFVTMYVILFTGLFIAILAVSDLDVKSAFSAVAGCLNNLGPGLGQVAEQYGSLNGPTKWLLILAMVLGRLEVFTLLVLLAPRYWYR